MKSTVSNEGLVLGGVLASAAGGLLMKYGPQVAKAIAGKVAETAGTAAMAEAKKQLANSNGVGSDLVRFTQSARVEPILLMDKNAVNVPFIQDVVHTAFNMFTGYWLLAVSLDAKINGISVGRRLDKFATDRSLGDATMTMISESLESYKASLEGFGLPFIEEILQEEEVASMEAVNGQDMAAAATAAAILDEEEDMTPQERKAADVERARMQKKADEAAAEARREVQAAEERARRAQEKADDRAQRIADEELRNAQRKADELESYARRKADELERIENERKERAKTGGTGVTNAAKYVEKITNLAVGNVIDVSIKEDGKEAIVPVTIRLRVAGMPSDVMVQTLAVGGKDVTFRSRWRAWRAGEIGFWSDFVLAMDRVDAHRAAMMKDETGYYKAVYGRATNNQMTAAILKDGPSLSTASSIIVMTEQTAKDLERRISGELKNFKTRQGIFGHTYSMLMIIVDPDWESVTIYTRGIEMPTKLTARDIKTAGKSDSKELMEILKSYQLGRAPGRF